MGLPKWDHIHALGQQHQIAQAWLAAKGAPMSHADVDRLYAAFTPMNTSAAVHHATLIHGVIPVIKTLREQGLIIGSTTGYNRIIMDVLAPLAAQQGFSPDNMVCADDLLVTRPTAMGMYQCFIDLGVSPAHAVVKVDDTVPGLLEGKAAGCWTVGLLASGNALGLSAESWLALSPTDKDKARAHARSQLTVAMPDYLIDTVADLMPVIEHIKRRLGKGQKPS